MREPRTRRGQERRDAIVGAAARLMYERGVHATSVGDVLEAAGAGKGQLYHYFSGKDDLSAAVLEHQLANVLGDQAQFRLDTWTGIRAWFDALLDGQRQRGFRGCPVGSLAIEMSSAGDELQERAAGVFKRWHSTLDHALQEMKGRGLLTARARTAELADTILTTIQGGYLLSTAERDLRPMTHALDLCYAHLRWFRPSRHGRGGASRSHVIRSSGHRRRS